MYIQRRMQNLPCTMESYQGKIMVNNVSSCTLYIVHCTYHTLYTILNTQSIPKKSSYAQLVNFLFSSFTPSLTSHQQTTTTTTKQNAIQYNTHNVIFNEHNTIQHNTIQCVPNTTQHNTTKIQTPSTIIIKQWKSQRGEEKKLGENSDTSTITYQWRFSTFSSIYFLYLLSTLYSRVSKFQKCVELYTIYKANTKQQHQHQQKGIPGSVYKQFY